jgi:hypothetical protein
MLFDPLFYSFLDFCLHNNGRDAIFCNFFEKRMLERRRKIVIVELINLGIHAF